MLKNKIKRSKSSLIMSNKIKKTVVKTQEMMDDMNTLHSELD